MALDPSRPLRRNTNQAMLAGVCAGLGDYIGWDHTLVRVLAVALTVLTGIWPGVIAYIVLWIITPPAGIGAGGEQQQRRANPPSEEPDQGKGGGGI